MTMTLNRARTRMLGAAALAAVTGLFAVTPPAMAGPCGPRQAIVDGLAANFMEKRTAMGLTGAGQLLEIFVSPNGTWTIVVTVPSGQACIVAIGDTWMPEPKPLGPEV
jgi:hypothetical protein